MGQGCRQKGNRDGDKSVTGIGMGMGTKMGTGMETMMGQEHEWK